MASLSSSDAGNEAGDEYYAVDKLMKDATTTAVGCAKRWWYD